MWKIEFTQRPGEGHVETSNFTLKEDAPKPAKEAGKLVLELKCISVDPYLRGRMNAGKSYIEPWVLNEAPESFGVLQVAESDVEGFSVGDYVTGAAKWQQFQLGDPKQLRKVDCSGDIGPEKYLSVLGIYSLSGYFPVDAIAKPKEGDVVYVSGAAGNIGAIAAQIFKIRGCKVIGSAGSEEKCKYATEELALDACFNYKTTSPAEGLKQHAPDGIDIYWDNVGGATLDAALGAMKEGGRVVKCGSISEYNTPADQRHKLENEALMEKKNITAQQFFLFQYVKEFGAGLQQLKTWYDEGKLKMRETVYEGHANITQALVDIFHGKNIGKMVIKC